jgi:hypothetical protein
MGQFMSRERVLSCKQSNNCKHAAEYPNMVSDVGTCITLCVYFRATKSTTFSKRNIYGYSESLASPQKHLNKYGYTLDR